MFRQPLSLVAKFFSSITVKHHFDIKIQMGVLLALLYYLFAVIQNFTHC